MRLRVSLRQIPVASPLSFSAEGANQSQSVTATDYAGNAATFVSPAVNIDLTPPATTALIAGGTVTLSATDNLSGVASTFYTVDSGTQQTYSTPFTPATLGQHSIAYWSVDNAGNIETAHTATTTVTGPTTSSNLSGTLGTNGWYKSTVTVTLTPTAGTFPIYSTFCTVDGGAQQTYSTPFTVTGDGAHKITFWSVDTQSNAEATNSQSFNIDTTPPTLTFGAPTPAANVSGWNNSTVTIPFTAADATSGVATATPGSPLTFSTQGASETQTVTVSDVAGNAAAFASPSVNIDLTPPVTASTVSGTTITLSATDNLSGVASTFYTVDGGAQQTYTIPFAVDAPGSHTITYWSVDKAGNVESAHTFGTTVTLPTTTSSLAGTPGNAGWYRSSVTVTLTATAGTLAIASTCYTLDGTVQQTYSAPFNVSGDGTHTITYWSVDSAGNAESAHSLTIMIDATAPTLVFGAATPAANASGWNSSTVTIPYTTSDATSGVASSTPGSPLTFASQGAGQTQTVTVTDVAGNTATFTSPPVSIDSTAPVTTESGASSGLTYVGTVTLALSATDNLSGVSATYYKLDTGAQTAYTGVNFGDRGRVAYAVYWSVDKAGNTESQHTLTFTIIKSPALSSVSVSPTSVVWGTAVTGTVKISSAAPTSGITVSLTSSNPAAASVPSTVTVPAGATSATFAVTSYSVSTITAVTITAKYLTVSKTATLTVKPAAVPLQINAGGPAVSPFAADVDFTGGSTSSTTHTISTAGVTSPAPMAVYQTQRYANSFKYTFAGLSPNASYTLRLHFAESAYTQAGKRVFNVTANTQTLLTSFDIYASVGEYQAVVKQFTVTADSTGKIVVSFSKVTGSAAVSGIELH